MSTESKEIEGCVLACLVIIGDPNSVIVHEAFMKLSPHCFTSVVARDLYEIIYNLYKEGKSFEYVYVSDLLKPQMTEYFHHFLNNQGSTSSLLGYIELLNDYRELRNMIKILSEAQSFKELKAKPNVIVREMKETLQKLQSCNSGHESNYLRTSAQIAEEFLDKSSEEILKIKTTIPNLPAIPNSSLITIAARSGIGKTMFALYMMDEILNVMGKYCLYFNLEMRPEVLVLRHANLLYAEGSTPQEKILHKIADIAAKNVSYLSKPMLTIEEIEAYSRYAALKEPLSVIVVDYIGLITSKNKAERNDLQQLNIAKRLAALSLDLNCVVLALTQVNRDFKTRPIGQRCPTTHDAAESMGTVHSSTWWLGIDRPEVDTEDPQWRHLFQVCCRKNREEEGLFNFNLDFIDGRFYPHQQKYSPMKNSVEID